MRIHNNTSVNDHFTKYSNHPRWRGVCIGQTWSELKGLFTPYSGYVNKDKFFSKLLGKP